MRNLNKMLYHALIGVFSIALVLSACKKDENNDDPGPTPTPAEPVNYVGATEDYGRPVTFITKEMSGDTWLMSYSISAQYIDTTQGQTQIYGQDYSQYSSEGIKKFTADSIFIDTGTGLTFTAAFKDNKQHLDGNYIYNYVGISTHTSDFATDREE